MSSCGAGALARVLFSAFSVVFLSDLCD